MENVIKDTSSNSAMLVACVHLEADRNAQIMELFPGGVFRNLK